MPNLLGPSTHRLNRGHMARFSQRAGGWDYNLLACSTINLLLMLSFFARKSMARFSCRFGHSLRPFNGTRLRLTRLPETVLGMTFPCPLCSCCKSNKKTVGMMRTQKGVRAQKLVIGACLKKIYTRKICCMLCSPR